MNVSDNSDSLQKLLQFSFRTTGYILTVGLGGFLILVWILTEPVMHLAIHLSDLYRTRFNPKIKGRI
jgi:hypothetical protein